MATTASTNLDPVRYEMFRRRLYNILEEGRLAIKMVSGSPVVVEGGETMCAFHGPDGTPILTAAGILLHCIGAWDFIRKCIEWYEDKPGIHDGDQFFFNDPYIGGQHPSDMVIIKPIFYGGERIAWTGSIMHTAETGGMEAGGSMARATEIFQEGIRIHGLKIVEKGEFRPEVFRTIVEQVRDPNLVGLDTKAKIAANNVCAAAYLQLVEKYGLEFVTAASRKIIEDSEKLARARLVSLPDGIWRAREYGDSSGQEEKPFKVECTMTKKSDLVTFDYSGTSAQNPGSINCTLPATLGNLFVALASQLFWDVPWNGGMFATVKLVAPEGTVVHCRFPAACTAGVTTVGHMVTQTATECISKMLYAGGQLEDVNSGWMGGHAGTYFGGINQFGNRFGGVILDAFAAGIGATPFRDGVHTGGNMMNPTSSVSDVEIIEMNMPFVYLWRRQGTDSGGFGKYTGGMGPEFIYMVYGTNGMRLGTKGLGRKTAPGHGIFGGYPPSFVQTRFVLDSNVEEWFRESRLLQSIEEASELQGKVIDGPQNFPQVPVRQFDMLISIHPGGGGYGDPLDRDPELVLEDVLDEVISPDTAVKIYGVIFTSRGDTVDRAQTEARRGAMRQERLREARPLRTIPPSESWALPSGWREAGSTRRIHEYLAIAEAADGRKAIACVRCGHVFADARENYKYGALLREHVFHDVKRRYVLTGEDTFVVFQEFLCPGCGTLVEVGVWCPQLDAADPILWDIQLDV